MESYCTAEYHMCPSWAAARLAETQGYDLRKTIDRQRQENASMRVDEKLREARLRLARERLASDTPEGRRLRRLLGVPEAA